MRAVTKFDEPYLSNGFKDLTSEPPVPLRFYFKPNLFFDFVQNESLIECKKMYENNVCRQMYVANPPSKLTMNIFNVTLPKHI